MRKHLSAYSLSYSSLDLPWFSNLLLRSSISILSLTNTFKLLLTLNKSRRGLRDLRLGLDTIIGIEESEPEESGKAHLQPLFSCAEIRPRATSPNSAWQHCTKQMHHSSHTHIAQLCVVWTYLVFMPSPIFEFRRAVHDSPSVIYHPTENLCIRSACLFQARENKPALFKSLPVILPNP